MKGHGLIHVYRLCGNKSHLPCHLVLAVLARTSLRSFQALRGAGPRLDVLVGPGASPGFSKSPGGVSTPAPERGRQGLAAAAQAGMREPIHYRYYHRWTAHLLM